MGADLYSHFKLTAELIAAQLKCPIIVNNTERNIQGKTFIQWFATQPGCWIPSTSANCQSVWKLLANLPVAPVNLTSTSNYFQMLPGTPGAKQSVFTLYKSILKYS